MIGRQSMRPANYMAFWQARKPFQQPTFKSFSIKSNPTTFAKNTKSLALDKINWHSFNETLKSLNKRFIGEPDQEKVYDMGNLKVEATQNFRYILTSSNGVQRRILINKILGENKDCKLLSNQEHFKSPDTNSLTALVRTNKQGLAEMWVKGEDYRLPVPEPSWNANRASRSNDRQRDGFFSKSKTKYNSNQRSWLRGTSENRKDRISVSNFDKPF